MPDGTLDLSQYIRVTNRTGIVIKSRYDGTDYIFKDGEPTDIHEVAARHIFSWGLDDKSQALHRHGFLKSLEDFKTWIDQIDFEEVPSPAVDIKTARKSPKNKRIASPTPLADGGAKEGEEPSVSSPTNARGDL